MAEFESPKFSSDVELVSTDAYESGLKRILNRHASNVQTYLEGQFRTGVLDEIYDHLWRVTTNSHDHIDPLHEHLMKGRSVIVTENPGMHLVWYGGLVFIKSIPKVLLSKEFWASYLPNQDASHGNPAAAIENKRRVLGFLRTYALLIDSESDFVVAQRESLITKEITYQNFQHFIDQFRNVPDKVVSKRYHYGQMRLTRLNWAVRLLQPTSTNSRFPWYYHEMRYTTTDWVRDYGAVFLFIFTVLSLFLAALQVKAQLGMSPYRKAISSGFADGVCYFLLSTCVVAGVIILVVWLLQCRHASKSRRMSRTQRAHDV